MNWYCSIFLLTFIANINFCFTQDALEEDIKWPTVGIAVLVRNKAHSLPYFLSCIHQLDYPKNRMYLWIHSDFNEDYSEMIINEWAKQYQSEYYNVYISINSSSGPRHADEETPTIWSRLRMTHLISLREKALTFARDRWADYLFMLDADVFLTNRTTLKELVKKNLPVVAPMLLSDGLYSNFWCGMLDFYYERTDDYKPIQSREIKGCFVVPMVHSAVLINLRVKLTDFLSYDPELIPDYDGPYDDIIAFASSAKLSGLSLRVCNDYLYGFVQVPLKEKQYMEDDIEHLINVKLEAISRGTPLPLDPFLSNFVEYPIQWRYGLDNIYMINLERRPERRALMEMNFREIGMDATTFKAVDGKDLDIDNLEDHSITIMPEYLDPYYQRTMKAGEVGCFLSHYNIWKEVVENKFKRVLVLEDDIHFVPNFRSRFLKVLDDLKTLDWDFMYVGRKVMGDVREEWVTSNLVRPLYSYWTLGYVLNQRGARKLLAANPLSNLVPVDEFLPIMFDVHPNVTWCKHFPKRDVIAYSVAPLLVYPTHYTGEEGYVSDTEDSVLVEELERVRKLYHTEL